MLRSFIDSDHNDRYKVMQATWRDDPDDRPTFTQLASIMGDFLEENVKQVRCTWMEKKKGGVVVECAYHIQSIMSETTTCIVWKPSSVLFWKLEY